jgi:flagellar M-ring protein FliF
VEQYLEKKAQNLVVDMVGANNARVQVSAAINFDKVDRTTQAIDPDKQALSTEQKAEITPGAQGGAGSTNIANAYENTKSTEVFSGAIGNIKRLTVAVLVNEKRIPPTGPTDTVPKYEARSAAELARIETLVRSAVGVDSARGDAVSVVSLQFETVPIAREPDVVPDLMTRVEKYERPAFTGLGLVLAFVVALMALKPLRAAAEGASGALAAGGAQAALSGGQGASLASQPSKPALAFSDAGTDMRDRVVSTVVKNPDSAARLMKTWIKDR